MSLMRNRLYVLALLSFFSMCSMVYAGCMPIKDLGFTVNIASMSPKEATMTTKATSDHTFSIIDGCTDPERLSIQYEIGQLADISNQSIDTDGRRFYKIQSVERRTSGSDALDYLTQHAYVSFSISAGDTKVAFNWSQDSPIDIVQFDAANNSSQPSSINLGLLDIQFHFDALPNNDKIVEQLASQPISLQVGQLNIQFRKQGQPESEVMSMTSALLMNIPKIEFERATCFVKNQSVTLDPLVVTAIKAGEAAGNAKAFDLNLECTGYLNQRNLHITWLDNNERDNQNHQGYLSSVQGASFSNVGVQISNELSKPIDIGQTYLFESDFSGQFLKKSYAARYYLAEGKPTVGTVNAQATLQIEYP